MSIRDDLVDLIVQADADVDERSFPDRIIDAILARYAVVELPALSEPDDDGQIYTYVADLRIDTSGPGGNEVFLPGGTGFRPPGCVKKPLTTSLPRTERRPLMWTSEYRALLRAIRWFLVAAEIERAYKPMPSDLPRTNGMADA